MRWRYQQHKLIVIRLNWNALIYKNLKISGCKCAIQLKKLQNWTPLVVRIRFNHFLLWHNMHITKNNEKWWETYQSVWSTYVEPFHNLSESRIEGSECFSYSICFSSWQQSVIKVCEVFMSQTWVVNKKLQNQLYLCPRNTGDSSRLLLINMWVTFSGGYNFTKT